jgi:hypothetical protein
MPFVRALAAMNGFGRSIPKTPPLFPANSREPVERPSPQRSAALIVGWQITEHQPARSSASAPNRRAVGNAGRCIAMHDHRRIHPIRRDGSAIPSTSRRRRHRLLGLRRLPMRSRNLRTFEARQRSAVESLPSFSAVFHTMAHDCFSFLLSSLHLTHSSWPAIWVSCRLLPRSGHM